jgi:hypothetical protein
MNGACTEQDRLEHGTGDGRPLELSHLLVSLI